MKRIETITKLINADILSNQTDLDWLEKRMPNITNLEQIKIARTEMIGYKSDILWMKECLELVKQIKIKPNRWRTK